MFPLNSGQFTMEEVLSRFQHIGEEIFESLDEESLEICKNVCRTWKNFIADPNRKFMWIQIIRTHEENAILDIGPLKNFISGPKPKWSKLRIQSLREFVNRLNSEKDKFTYKLNGFVFNQYIQSINNITLHKIKVIYIRLATISCPLVETHFCLCNLLWWPQ